MKATCGSLSSSIWRRGVVRLRSLLCPAARMAAVRTSRSGSSMAVVSIFSARGLAPRVPMAARAWMRCCGCLASVTAVVSRDHAVAMFSATVAFWAGARAAASRRRSLDAICCGLAGSGRASGRRLRDGSAGYAERQRGCGEVCQDCGCLLHSEEGSGAARSGGDAECGCDARWTREDRSCEALPVESASPLICARDA